MFFSHLAIGFGIPIANEQQLRVKDVQLRFQSHKIRRDKIAETAVGAPVNQQNSFASKVRKRHTVSGQIRQFEGLNLRADGTPYGASLRTSGRVMSGCRDGIFKAIEAQQHTALLPDYLVQEEAQAKQSEGLQYNNRHQTFRHAIHQKRLGRETGSMELLRTPFS